MVEPVTVGNSPWPIVFLCAALFLFTVIFVPFRRKMILILRSLFSQRHFSLMMRESKILEESVFLFTLIFDVMVFATGLLTVAQKMTPQFVEKLTEPGLFGILFVALLLVYWLKTLIYKVYTSLFDHPKELLLICSYKFVFLTIAAVSLYPFVLIAQITGQMKVLYAYVPVFSVYWVILLYKLFKINPRQINLFHFFLYFCTLEILPYVLMTKMISML